SVEIRGIPLHIIDTAGLRDSADPVERIGIERTWATIARADLALIVTDARDSGADADAAIVARLPPSLRRIAVRNKIDLAGIEPKRSALAGAEEVWLSAKTGAGVELLRDAMLAAAGVHEDMEGTFLARERHLHALRLAGRISTTRRATCKPRRHRWSSSPRSSAARSRRLRRSPAT